MISAPIGEMTNLFGTMNAGATNKSAGDQLAAGTDTFQDIMSTVSTKSSDNMNAGVNQAAKTDASKANKSSSDNAVNKDVNRDDAQDVNNREKELKKDSANEVTKSDSTEKTDSKEVAETVKELSKDIEESVAEELNISVDELEKILENLGITAMDLLNTQNVSQLVATVMGDGDMMSLVTEEGLSDVVLSINNDIKDLVQVASDSLSMNTTDFTDLLANMEPVSDEESREIIASLTEEPQSIDTSAKAATDVNMTDTKDAVVSIKNEDSKVSDAEDTDKEVITTQQATSSEINSAKNDEDLSGNNQGFGRNTEKKSDDKADTNLSSQQTVSVEAKLNDVTFNPDVLDAGEEVSQVNTQDIIDQITENMKLMRSNDVTELEMQLNPESLGNIHLTVASKEGNVTAQLEAQNESVRAALELQIQQLKENLEAQGVKVTAVEVTVASHSFEENLQQGDDSNDAMNKEQERLRKATRKLNINELLADDNIEDLDDEEIITAKMMAADGNSMDYRA